MARLLLGSCVQSVCQCVLFFWRCDVPFFPLFRGPGLLERLFPLNQVLCPAVSHIMMHTILKPGFLCYQEHFFSPKALAVAFQGSSKNLGQVRQMTVPLWLCPLI